jgi:hypothetical protein
MFVPKLDKTILSLIALTLAGGGLLGRADEVPRAAAEPDFFLAAICSR